MNEVFSRAGRKVAAVGILLVVGWIVFKLVLGFVTGLLWIAVLLVGLAAVIWAMRVL